MSKNIEGKISAKGLKFAIVLSRFNSFIGDKLLDGAKDAILRHGGTDEDIHVFRVPGAFEIPQMAKKLVEKSKYNAVICLGAVIRGGTPHFEYVASEVSKGIANVGLETGVPVIYGIITAESLEQAIERAGTKMGNAGYNAALSAIETANLMKSIQ